MSVVLQERLFSVPEYHAMGEAGILTPEDHVELIEGRIVTMSPIGSRHAACVDRLTQLFFVTFQTRTIVRVQNPIRLGNRSEPEPDVALLKPRDDFYAAAHPGPDDVLLVVEVAETSAETDRQVKLPLYARHGIPEVWIVDLNAGIVEQYLHPVDDQYTTSLHLQRTDTITTSAFPEQPMNVTAMLGPGL